MDPVVQDAKEWKPKFKLKGLKVIGEGSYGCVVTAKVKNEDDYEVGTEKIAVKLQLIPENKQPLFNTAKNEQVNQLRLEKLVRGMVTCPFFAHHFRWEKVIIQSIDDAPWLRELSKCNAIQVMVERNQFPLTLYTQEMKVYTGRTLRDILGVIDSEEARLNRTQIATIAVQIVFTLYVLWKQAKIRHQDVKSDNILTGRHFHTRSLYSLYTGPGMSRIVTLGKDTCPYEVFLSDFGLAQRSDESNVRPNRTFRPLLNAISRTEHRNEWISCDVWAVGMLVMEMALAGWKCTIKRTDHSIADGIPDIYNLDSVFRIGHMITGLSVVASNLADICEKNRTGITETRGALELGLKNVLCYWLLMEYLGVKLEDELLDMDRAYMACSLGELRESVEKARVMTTYEGMNIFGEIARELRERLGTPGIVFVKACLSWTHSKRMRFGMKYPSNNAEETNEMDLVYMVAMSNTFFDSLQVDKHEHCGYTNAS